MVPDAGRQARRGGFAGRLVRSEYFVLLLCALYALAAYPFVPVLFSAEVAGNMIADMSPLLIVAVGQTFVLVIAGIDLSITAVIALSAVVGASIMTQAGGYLPGNGGVLPAILAMLGVGGAVGLLNGLSVTRLNMPPFLVTLATRMFFAGLAIWYTTFHTTSSSIADLPPLFTGLYDFVVLTLPIGESVLTLPLLPVLIAVIVVIGAHVTLSRTMLGRWIYAVGANRRTARVSGIPVESTIILAFTICGVCAALTGILMSSRLQTGSPILGENVLLDVIGAVVIGGTSLFGGKGKIVWTLSGVLFLVLLDTTLKLLGASLFLIFIIKGAVILAAATLDTLRNRIFVEH
ncbi:ABC transporter permease [Taklimakanibacter lacteus]|uniref:ABC transporter permease n=1 Tax=Taklimakanibacter lacteus TaxID=2268456 RepID=UPI0013C427ED